MGFVENYTCRLLGRNRRLRASKRRGLPHQTPRRESAPIQVVSRHTSAAAAAAAITHAAEPSCYSSHQDPMTTAAPGDPPPTLLLGPVLGSLPADLFQQEVLRLLGPTDLASLAGAGRGCAAAVAATALMTWAKHAKMAPLSIHLGYYLRPLCLKEACSHAARFGNREMLEWLHNTGCPWSDATAWAAAGGGHLEILLWLHSHGCPWDYRTCGYAARTGHLRVLQWAWEHHCPWGPLTTIGAAEGGHLEVLSWARYHGCPWNVCACVYAAMQGHLEVLQWVWENDTTGEVWNEANVRRYAAGPRKQEVLTWLDLLSDP